jgi:hypothetical protein
MLLECSAFGQNRTYKSSNELLGHYSMDFYGFMKLWALRAGNVHGVEAGGLLPPPMALSLRKKHLGNSKARERTMYVFLGGCFLSCIYVYAKSRVPFYGI